MSAMVFENWCRQSSVRFAIGKLLNQASKYFPASLSHVLQLQGEPVAHDAALHFIHLYPEIQSYRQAYTVVADPASLPFMPEQFDVVLAMFPYETLGEEELWIQEALRVLTEDGFLVVVGINPLSLDGVCDRVGIKRFPDESCVVSPFRVQEEIVNHGFKHLGRHYKHLPWAQLGQVEVPAFKVGGQADDLQAGWFDDWYDGVIMLDVYQLEAYVPVPEGLVVV